MKLNTSDIEKIEKSLSIELYQTQKDYLINDAPMPKGKQNGKTLAHCIKLALSEDEPLDMCHPENFCDDDYGSKFNKVPYAKMYYRHMFRGVLDELKTAGFPVRAVVVNVKSIVVMNGQFYSGENTKDNKLLFNPDRTKAVEVDERRLRFITQTVLRWFMNREIDLERFEILKVGGGKHV